jgi:two-component system sensor histidine kinase UhpB
MKNTAALAWVYDESGKLLYANHEFRERTGLNDTSIGKNIAEITTDPEVFSMVNHKINRILSGEKLIINEDTIKDKNGVTRNYLAYWFLLDLNDNRKLIGGQAIDITEKKNASEKLEKSDTLFRTFMNNSLASAWIYDEDNKLVFGNKLFLESKGITGDYKGRHVTSFATVEAAKKIIARNQRLLQSGQPMITVDNFKDLNGNNAYYLVYSFILPIDDSKRLIGGQAIDITDKKNAQEQVDKINERFTYAVNASSDAIWDLDLRTNEIYRSDNFSKISGYESHQVEPTLDWWYNKIHPDDRERIAQNTKMFIDQGVEQWQDEYRFLYADGTYRYLVDKGFNVFENGKPVRVIGAIQDITERKKLEAQLLNEQIQKQKQINKATIEAQERERGMISGELHDNVNQLLMSAKLHIGVAKNGGDNQNDLLDKASDYLLMAVEEIRALSRKLNTSVVEKVGLEKCIIDISQNLTMLNKVETEVAIEEGIIDKLNREQRLMVLRIVQEQTNNIIKYAAASEASVSLQTKNNQCRLCISDNGKGFDKTKEKVNGIGLINIFNRVDAYNGKVEIISSPGKGCTIDILFPFED